jgi:hypothetical protein
MGHELPIGGCFRKLEESQTLQLSTPLPSIGTTCSTLAPLSRECPLFLKILDERPDTGTTCSIADDDYGRE